MGSSPHEQAEFDEHLRDSAPVLEAPALKTDTVYKAATFIETYTGRAFWPLNPTTDALSIIDIAHALSNQCRYSGHVRFFYSVAQHCCLLASHVASTGGSALDCLQMLMHDAPEAYLVDIPRPVKQYMPQYRVWDHAINDVIREWMGWQTLAMPAMQDELDSRIIVDERAQLLDPARRNDWGHRLLPIGLVIEPWTPQEAERSFLMQYAAYSKAVYGTHQYLNHEWGIPVSVNMPTMSEHLRALDVLEVDVRGRVGRIKLRNSDTGMLVRDRSGVPNLRDAVSPGGPKPDWEWQHGEFTVLERSK